MAITSPLPGSITGRSWRSGAARRCRCNCRPLFCEAGAGEHRRAVADQGFGQEVLDTRSLLWSLLQHPSREITNLLAVELRRHRLGVLVHNVHNERCYVRARKRRLQGQDLVEHHTERPDIGLLAVGSAIANFRRQISWGAHHGHSLSACAVEHLGNAEVPKLHHGSLRQEDILALQITMEDVLRMDMLKCQAALYEDPYSLILRVMLTF
mmetsp:Transcript_44298/g.96265  ORF Transcript_44298/g.96265 Transcript_44298/m.96265 type:complete len:210 (+) Transcript_44298:3-632(+)